AFRVLRQDTPKFRRLSERPRTGVATASAFAVERADLDANPACDQPRQPVAFEEPATQGELEVALANDDLEQHVGVRVDDQAQGRCGGSSSSSSHAQVSANSRS